MKEAAMREWERVIPAKEREIYRLGGYGRRQSFGKRPVLLLVDITHAFTGSRPMPIKQAIEEFPSSCGAVAWRALPFISRLLYRSRARGIPVVFTTGDTTIIDTGVRTTKAIRNFSGSAVDAHGFVDTIAPRAGELVIRKAMASAFFGTPLASYLRRRGVDSIILGGTSTSGCVRATSVDGHSYGFPVFPVEECCFDRTRTSHLVNLFEINSRYGTVITLAETLRWLGRC
jgi:nicotinamidase-related amidase